LLYSFVAIIAINAASALASGLLQSDTHRREPDVYYRFGKITVESPTVFTPEQIIRLARIKSNTFASPAVIEQAGDLINRAYLKRGHLRASVTVDAEYQLISPRTKQGLVEIKIRIIEGSVFRTRRLEIAGNSNTREQIIRRKVLLNEGEPYTDELLDKSLDRLNGLGLFEKLTRSNVKLAIYDDENIVDVTIYLQEKRSANNRR